MNGSSSAPPPLIDFTPLPLSNPGSSPSSPIQNADIVTPREERNILSDVSTELVLGRDPWKIKKKLTESDVNHSARLLLPLDCLKADVFPKMGEEMMRRVESRDGMGVHVLDMDTEHEHQLVFRHWGSGSYVLNSGWTKLFVKERGLKVGDEIGMFWDGVPAKFHFKVL